MYVTVRPKSRLHKETVKKLGERGWVVLRSKDQSVLVVKENKILSLTPEEIL